MNTPSGRGLLHRNLTIISQVFVTFDPSALTHLPGATDRARARHDGAVVVGEPYGGVPLAIGTFNTRAASLVSSIFTIFDCMAISLRQAVARLLQTAAGSARASVVLAGGTILAQVSKPRMPANVR